ncbi:MAG: tyrosine-type recombinase/integrase, partial [Proteobacteria bacterium]|nr:tyrosine-type recombinase/integrase [Pseudomonadota bacterium]
MKLEIQASGIAQPSTEKDFDLVATFFGGKRPLTREAYQLDLKDFTEFLGAASTADALNELTSLNSGDANHRVLLYRSMMQEKKLAPATINRRLATIRSITKLARVLGKITWAIEIPNLAVQNYRDTKGPALAAFKRMLDATKESSPIKSARDLALLRLLFDLALRASEAVSLDIADYDLEASTLAILGKGRTQKEKLTVPDTSKTALKIWITERGSEAGPLFVNF